MGLVDKAKDAAKKAIRRGSEGRGGGQGQGA